MRTKQFHVSPDVYEAYWALAKARNGNMKCTPISPDEIADEVLRNHIANNHPKLFSQLYDRRKQVDAIEKQLIEQLTKSNPPT